MKKTFKLLLVVLLGFAWIQVANAKVPLTLPKTGVTYFMMYPDGEEIATENYNEAINPQERLLYTEVTDENGFIYLCDLTYVGQLRLVQHVPDGYTTNERELRIDLTDPNVTSASFIDYRGLNNPSTNRTLIVLLGVIGVAGVSFLVSRKNKKSLLLIPIVIVGVLTIYHVHATNDKTKVCFPIQVKDGAGNALRGVTVDVYGTPDVTANPAIKVDANGGYFADGTTIMYIRIPYEGCDVEEMIDALSQEQRDAIDYNIAYSYRLGYRRTSMDAPSVLHNGDVIYLHWTEDGGIKLATIHGNGGTIEVNGKKYDQIQNYQEQILSIASTALMTKLNERYIGIDDNQSCSHYGSNGMLKQNAYINYDATDLYACWNALPDGIYVNDELYFKGNDDSCFNESEFEYDSNGYTLYKNYGRGYYELDVYIENNNIPHFYLSYEETIGRSQQYREELDGVINNSQEITSIKYVKNGQVIVFYEAGDLVLENGSYKATNQTKIEEQRNYERLIGSKCVTHNE